MIIETIVRQRLFQDNNKRYFNSNKNTEIYYGMELFTNWIRKYHKMVLKIFLEEKDAMQK